MFDINEIMKRAQQAKEQALDSVKETMEKNEERINEIEVPGSEKSASVSAAEVEEQISANTQRQVEILGQLFGPDSMEHLFGEDMGVLAAALETLEMEETDDEEELPFNLELEENLCAALEEAMARLASMPEPEAVPYQRDDVKWERFGILLSGILSTLNSHNLDRMDVEEHIPVMEQKIVSLVRRSWGIDGRSGLLDMIRYLAQEGYTLRYQLYSQASLPEEMMDETMDEEDRESARRAWRFAQRYKSQYAPGFMAGWDVGRAAMLTRWGCYLGWITESEAVGILWELSQKVVEELHSWREFARSYLFGGLMWKLLCGDSSAGSYLGYLADAAADLLTGKAEQDSGQWRDCPWPAKRKIGYTL
ncbi:MAG: DUF1266 domain-containing protein [Lachnospiraceae bacterium]|nr:DUF1266 domain-containing protein [Lachnospiraceae bacterium]